jgi:LuxR family maltose regulon positive regulatory protein
MKLMDTYADKRVIFIHAPAGFGKTVSASLWIEHRKLAANAKHAWIGIDEYDNKTADFCGRVVSALAGLQPGNAALKEFVTHPLFQTASVEYTLNALRAFSPDGEEYILVFDDIHVIVNHEIIDFLTVLFKRMPANCKAVILSRAAPPKQFAGIMMKDEMAIVNADELQFSRDEIRMLFEKNGRRITSGQAEEVLASTGGWAIGIGALLLSGGQSYTVKLTNQYLEDFLRVHVWERWDDVKKTFMTFISVADELNAEICAQLTKGELNLKERECADLLAELVRENAFLRETGSGTYKFHDLFREFLYHMLEERGKKTVQKQWKRAGDCFFAEKDYFRSVDCFIKGGNIDNAANSLYHMYDYNSAYASIEDTLYTIHSSVSEAVVEKHPFLLEVLVWAAFVEGRADDFEALLDRYYKLFPKIVIQKPRSAAILVMLSGIDYRRKLMDTVKSVKLVPFKSSYRIPTPSISQNMPYIHRSFLDFSDWFMLTEKEHLLFDKTLGEFIGGEYDVIKECLHAGRHYEAGNVNEAYRHALAALANISEDCSPEIQFCAMMILAAVLYAEGQDADAENLIENIRGMIERHKAYYLNANLQAYTVRIKLNNGDREAAAEWLRNHDGNPHTNISFYKLYRHFTSVRARIVLGDYTNALLMLQKLLNLSERYRRPLDITEALLLLSVVYRKMGRNEATAIGYMERAVLTAHKNGYTQIFAAEGAELVNMLHKLQKRSVQKQYADTLPSNFIKTVQIAAITGAKRCKGLTGGAMRGNLTFTDKQKEVMLLLCEGFSRNEIAVKMGLKPYTIKSHIELIYKKLDVANNVDAVMKIQKMGIL